MLKVMNDSDLTRAARALVLIGLLVSLLIGVVAFGAAAWSHGVVGCSVPSIDCRCCLPPHWAALVNVSRWGTLILSWPTLAFGLLALGRRRWWLRWGWGSALVSTLCVAFVLSTDFLSIEPYPPGHGEWAWLFGRLGTLPAEGALWLAIAGVMASLHWLGHGLLALGRRVSRLRSGARPVPRPQSNRTRQFVVFLAVALAGVGGAAMGSVAISYVFGDELAPVLAVGLCTACLTALVVGLSVRLTRTRAQAIVACLLGAPAAAILNSPASFILLTTIDPSQFRFDDVDPMSLATLVGMVGASVSAPLGGLFGVVLLVPVLLTHRFGRSRAVEAPDRALRALGGWLTVVGVVAMWLASAVPSLAMAQELVTRPPGALPFAVFAFVTGLASLAGGSLRVRARRRWLARVRAGQVPNWTLEPRGGTSDVERLRPFFVASKGGEEQVLVEHVPGFPSGAYRTGEITVPRALVTG